MITNSRTQYKIIVEEYKDSTSFTLTLLSRDQKEPIEFLKNLGYVEIEHELDHIIEKYKLNDDSKIVDMIYNNEGKIIHHEELTIGEYKDF